MSDAETQQVRTDRVGPRVLVEARPDSASVNIADQLRVAHDWSETGWCFDGHTVLRLDGSDPEVFLATIDDWHIHREGLGEALAVTLGRPLEALLVLSRHRAASGMPSFTAHPVGNPGVEAIAGGRARTPTPTHPHLLAAAYRALKREAATSHLPHSVSLEATHHGPETAVPVVFIEIGSDDRHWSVPEAGRVVARAAHAAVTHVADDAVPVVMGIGGGHYAPQMVRLLEETRASVGHMIASYHWSDGAEVPDEVIERFLRASAPPGQKGPSGVYFDRKSLPGPQRRAVLAALERLGTPLLRTKDLVPAGGSGASENIQSSRQ